MANSYLENQFKDLWTYYYPDINLLRDYKFAKGVGRKFEADFIHLSTRVIIEIQGGINSNKKMGHNSGTGITRDCRKLFLANQLGFTTFFLTDKMLNVWHVKAIATIINQRLTYLETKK